ncbi:unnamed protein product [Acanthoscelides obtectus]|nr:unnamed protein product [Acanthoscelides obtectus]CAK1674169.1 hypothetical protein AOBTE_LOCUS29549 [Acanthoscelides obtectus]
MVETQFDQKGMQCSYKSERNSNDTRSTVESSDEEQDPPDISVEDGVIYKYNISENMSQSEEKIVPPRENYVSKKIGLHEKHRPLVDLSRSKKLNDSGMVETQFDQKGMQCSYKSERNFNDTRSTEESSDEEQDPPDISVEDGVIYKYNTSENMSQSEENIVPPRENYVSKKIGLHEKHRPVSDPTGQIRILLNDKEYRSPSIQNNCSDDEMSETEGLAEIDASHIHRQNKSLTYNISGSTTNSNNEAMNENRNLDCDTYKAYISSYKSSTDTPNYVHLDVSTDTSSNFDASCFYGDEPWDPEMDSTTDEGECETSHEQKLTEGLKIPTPVKSTARGSPLTHKIPTPVQSATGVSSSSHKTLVSVKQPTPILSPGRFLIQNSETTPQNMKSPQIFKHPEAVSVKKAKSVDKFKDIISPVRLYIQHSPVAHLKQNVVPHPSKSQVVCMKSSSSVNKKMDKLDTCKELPPVIYKPAEKKIVTMKSKQLFMPPSLGKHVVDPLVIKHEKKLNVKEVSRLTEKLGLDESELETDKNDESANMSVLCIKKNF